MKKIFFVIGIVVLFCGCSFEQKARIEIQNKSDFVVYNFILTYASSKGDKTETIDILKIDSNKTFNVTISEETWGFGGGVYTAPFLVEYKLNDKIFSAIDDFDSVQDANGSYYNNNAILLDNTTAVIIIYNEGYKIK